jgi:ribonucleoside-triphosphate reductase
MGGGVALHCNLEEHLSKKQYLMLIDYAIKYGTSYFTFNIPNSQCDDCGFISKQKLHECPKCGSKKITWWTRIIGYLRPISAFSKGRQIEASRRVYGKVSEQ